MDHGAAKSPQRTRSSASRRSRSLVGSSPSKSSLLQEKRRSAPAAAVASPFDSLPERQLGHSDTIATAFGYFIGYCNPHCETWVRSKACEVLFAYVRRVPKYDPKRKFELSDLTTMWKEWRAGCFDEYRDDYGRLHSWAGAVASLPRISGKQRVDFCQVLQAWVRGWHVDSFLDWLVGYHSLDTAPYFARRATTRPTFEQYMHTALPYSAAVKARAGDCYLWPPVHYAEIDQIAALLASITKEGRPQLIEVKRGRIPKAKIQELLVPQTPSPIEEPKNSPPPQSIPLSSPQVPIAAPSSSPSRGSDRSEGLPAADQVLFDAIASRDLSDPTRAESARKTVSYLHTLNLAPSQMGCTPSDLAHPRTTSLLAYERPRVISWADASSLTTAQGAFAEPRYVEVLLWTALLNLEPGAPPTEINLRCEVISDVHVNGDRYPLDLSDPTRFDFFQFSLLKDFQMETDAAVDPVQKLKSLVDDLRLMGFDQVYTVDVDSSGK